MVAGERSPPLLKDASRLRSWILLWPVLKPCSSRSKRSSRSTCPGPHPPLRFPSFQRSTALLRSSRCRLKPVQGSMFNGVKADARSKGSSRSCLESKAWPRSILLRTPGMTAHGSFACRGWIECQVNSPALVPRAVQWLRRSYEPIKTRPDGS